jgi:hypothetical protein
MKRLEVTAKFTNLFQSKRASLATGGFDLLLGHCSFPEAVLKFSCHILHVAHASSSGGATTLSLLTPIVLAHFRAGVTARRASLLLDVKGGLPASTACRVRLGVSLTE